MAVSAPTSAKVIPPYPASIAAATIRNELLRAVRAQLHRKGQTVPTADDELTIMAVEIDSLTVVELLACLDDILPFKVTESVVKAGGYGAIEDAVKHVVGRIQSKWSKHYSRERS